MRRVSVCGSFNHRMHAEVILSKLVMLHTVTAVAVFARLGPLGTARDRSGPLGTARDRCDRSGPSGGTARDRSGSLGITRVARIARDGQL